MTAPPPLSAGDVLALLARLGDVAERVVLVGGQAVNLWAEHYLSLGRAEVLVADAPFASKDIDFCASRATVRLFATRLRGGTAILPTLDDATPQVGLVKFVDELGQHRAPASPHAAP